MKLQINSFQKIQLSFPEKHVGNILQNFNTKHRKKWL